MKDSGKKKEANELESNKIELRMSDVPEIPPAANQLEGAGNLSQSTSWIGEYKGAIPIPPAVNQLLCKVAVADRQIPITRLLFFAAITTLPSIVLGTLRNISGLIQIKFWTNDWSNFIAHGDFRPFFLLGIGQIFCVCYFIPVVLGNLRGVRDQMRLLALNTFTGWTGIGWVLALRHSLRSLGAAAPTRVEVAIGLVVASTLLVLNALLTLLLYTHMLPPHTYGGYIEWSRVQVFFFCCRCLLLLQWIGCSLYLHRTRRSLRGGNGSSSIVVLLSALFTAGFCWYCAEVSSAANLLLSVGHLGWLYIEKWGTQTLQLIVVAAYSWATLMLNFRLMQELDSEPPAQNRVWYQVSPCFGFIIATVSTQMDFLLPTNGMLQHVVQIAAYVWAYWRIAVLLGFDIKADIVSLFKKEAKI